MTYTRLNSIILMGKDDGTPDAIKKSIQKKQSIDGERYLDDINKYLIFLNGTSLLSYYLEEIDVSKKLTDRIVVVGDGEIKWVLPFLTNNMKKEYVFLQQGNNRFDNIIKATEEFNLHGKTYISGADLPLVTSIDDRIAEIDKGKNANFALARIENFNDFWRSPFFLYNNISDPRRKIAQGYKEPQDFIADIDRIDLKTINDLNPGTKLADPKVAMQLLTRIIKLSAGKIKFESLIGLIDETQNMMYSRKKHLAGNEYSNPNSRGGNFGKLLDFAAPLINLGREDIAVSESKNMGFYMDLDSVQDAYWHALHNPKKSSFENYSSYEELEENMGVTYLGFTSLLDVDSIKRDIPDKKKFFDYMRARDKKMLAYTNKYSENKL